jgi:hypothetical protein
VPKNQTTYFEVRSAGADCQSLQEKLDLCDQKLALFSEGVIGLGALLGRQNHTAVAFEAIGNESAKLLSPPRIKRKQHPAENPAAIPEID